MFFKNLFKYQLFKEHYSQTIKTITDEEIKKTIDITQKNITNIVNRVSNKFSVIVESNNFIVFKNVKFINSSGTIEINQKNANVLMIDEEFKQNLTENIYIETETNFYNCIIENLSSEELQEINKNLSSETSNIDIKDYTQIENKDYSNILNEIHNTIENYGYNSIINKCITNVEQYNYIDIDTVQFGGSSYLTKAEYETKKTKIDFLFNQENTIDLMVKCIADSQTLTDIFNSVLSDLDINKEITVIVDPVEPEKPIEDPEVPEEPKDEPVIKPETPEIPEKQETPEIKHATFKDILKEPLIYITLFLVIFIIFFITFLFYKNK